MFDFSFAEIALIVVVTVVFIGPKELPVVVMAIAKALKSLRSLAGEIRKAMDELAEESGIKEAAGDIEREVKMIKGDDGKMYESYGGPPIPPDVKHGG